MKEIESAKPDLCVNEVRFYCATRLPVIQTVPVRISGISRTVGGQVALQPPVGNERSGRLKFIGANIDGAAHDARVAVEIGLNPCMAPKFREMELESFASPPLLPR